MRGNRLVAVLLAAGVSVIPTAGVSSPAATGAAPRTVKAKMTQGDWAWGPKTVHVVTPKRIKWKNPTVEPHTVRFYKGPMKGVRFLVPEGKRRIRKIKKAGIHKYRCDIPGHSKMVTGKCTGMCGKVVAH